MHHLVSGARTPRSHNSPQIFQDGTAPFLPPSLSFPSRNPSTSRACSHSPKTLAQPWSRPQVWSTGRSLSQGDTDHHRSLLRPGLWEAHRTESPPGLAASPPLTQLWLPGPCGQPFPRAGHTEGTMHASFPAGKLLSHHMLGQRSFHILWLFFAFGFVASCRTSYLFQPPKKFLESDPVVPQISHQPHALQGARRPQPLRAIRAALRAGLHPHPHPHHTHIPWLSEVKPQRESSSRVTLRPAGNSAP